MEYDVLIQRARQGDTGAFDALYRLLYAPLFRFVLMRMKDRELAEDVTQETFVVFVQHLKTFGSGSPLPYLHTVARNKIIDHFRRRTPDVNDDALWALADSAPTPEESARLGEEVSGVFVALKTLSSAEAEVVKARYLDGLTTAEVATLLDKTEEAVRQLLSRGMRSLRAYYDDAND
ncbi:MAG: sigma-70 family RNA polymerase sigma factor [Candidatus Pacebacteria bacterium]|nr:sigma-70 family RNA polymerase sigma factor [Candidatus Paceibacterota bacterium]